MSYSFILQWDELKSAMSHCTQRHFVFQSTSGHQVWSCHILLQVQLIDLHLQIFINTFLFSYTRIHAYVYACNVFSLPLHVSIRREESRCSGNSYLFKSFDFSQKTRNSISQSSAVISRHVAGGMEKLCVLGDWPARGPHTRLCRQNPA